MLLHIPAIFRPDEVERIRSALEQAPWADGKITAGHQSAKAKHNLQLPESHPLAKEIGAGHAGASVEQPAVHVGRAAA
jgi:PKHD-type hydroxylase